MSDFGTMVNRIMDEMILETSLTMNVKQAIISSVNFYERQRFYFNERLSLTFTASTGQELYTSADLAEIATIAEIDELTIFVNTSSRYPLSRKTWAWINRAQVDTTGQGQPTDYCYYAEQIRLYPIPSGIYPIVISGTERFSTLSADNDTNAWVVDAEELIRYSAKKRLALDTLHDVAQASSMAELERDSLKALSQETFRRLSTGRVVPTTW